MRMKDIKAIADRYGLKVTSSRPDGAANSCHCFAHMIYQEGHRRDCPLYSPPRMGGKQGGK